MDKIQLRNFVDNISQCYPLPQEITPTYSVRSYKPSLFLNNSLDLAFRGRRYPQIARFFFLLPVVRIIFFQVAAPTGKGRVCTSLLDHFGLQILRLQCEAPTFGKSLWGWKGVAVKNFGFVSQMRSPPGT